MVTSHSTLDIHYATSGSKWPLYNTLCASTNQSCTSKQTDQQKPHSSTFAVEQSFWRILTTFSILWPLMAAQHTGCHMWKHLKVWIYIFVVSATSNGGYGRRIYNVGTDESVIVSFSWSSGSGCATYGTLVDLYCISVVIVYFCQAKSNPGTAAWRRSRANFQIL